MELPKEIFPRLERPRVRLPGTPRKPKKGRAEEWKAQGEAQQAIVHPPVKEVANDFTT